MLEQRIKLLIQRTPAEQAQIAEEMFHSRVMSPDAVDRMLAQVPAVINTDHNRWLEYATPRYNSSNAPWIARNLAFLRGFGPPR
jgi:hypothetical protein